MQEQAQIELSPARPEYPAKLSKIQIANLCCGLFGVQIVWALQNANTSRIFQTLGAQIDELPLLWIAGPIAGLLVQPIIGEWSDRTWGRWGRRRPFMIVGAVLSAAALVAMARAETVWSAALALWLLTCSINVVMEPFRALMGDSAPAEGRDEAFATQVLFIGAGAVFASILPWILVHWGVVAPSGTQGQMAPSVRASFDIGALGLLMTVMWTVATTREHPRENIAGVVAKDGRPIDQSRRSKFMRRGAVWIAGAAGIALLDAATAQRREGYLLAATIALFGAFHWLAAQSAKDGRNPLVTIASEVIGMPRPMRRLAVVQFFTWFGLFALWVYAVPAISERFYGNSAAGTLRYEDAANWVGILFAAYNGVAALAALILPVVAARLGRRRTHALCLVAGAVGLAGFVVAPDPRLLWVSVFAIGCAWASILAIPYAIVAAVVPPERMGVYMGIHNVFLVLPQLAGAALLGPFVSSVLHGHMAGVFLIGAAAMLVASAFTLTIPAID